MMNSTKRGDDSMANTVRSNAGGGVTGGVSVTISNRNQPAGTYTNKNSPNPNKRSLDMESATDNNGGEGGAYGEIDAV